MFDNFLNSALFSNIFKPSNDLNLFGIHLHIVLDCHVVSVVSVITSSSIPDLVSWKDCPTLDQVFGLDILYL
jgi:hypothetical protein